MRAKGYSQKDVIQADVQKAYAEGIGNMGPAIASGGGGSGIMGDLLGLGVGMAAAGAIAPQIGTIMEGFRIRPQAEASTSAVPASPTSADTWDCPACGAKGIASRFCPECGAKRPEAPKGWNCPDCGTANIMTKFCPNCGAKRPEDGWTCPDCGTKDIKTGFCPNCGRKKGEST